MRPIYLSFPDEATWLKLSAEDKYAALTPNVLGKIVKQPATEDATEDAKPITVPGFHVNMLGELPEELAKYEVFPETPACVYGGWSPEEIEARKSSV